MRSIKDTCGDMVVFEALEPRLLLSGTIEGQLWHDLNADGVKDAGEPGLAGWTIELTDLLLGGTMTTATSGDGQYSFDALLPGSYEVRQIDQTGWTQTAPGEPGYHAVELVDDALGLDFGDVQTGSLSGVSFNDLDGNSVRDPGEPGLAGWTLELVDSSTGAVVAITVTSAGAFEGEYEFTNVIPGDYEVRQTAQVGWVQSYPVTSTHSFSVSGGDDLTGNNFGNTQGALASGQKYSDLNANGVRDAGEPGLDGWTIELYESQSGLLVDTVVTTSIDLDESGDIDPETESGLYTFIVLDPVELLGEPVSEIMDAISVNEFYRSSKQWKSTTSMSGAVGNNVYRYSGTVKNAWWVFDNLPEAQYRVWASWGLNAAIASSAEVPYSIYEGGTISGGSSSASYTGGTLHEEFIVDQTALPSDELEGGIWWRSLGEHIVEGQLVVEIQGPQDGSVEDVRCAFADAIRIEGTPANYIIREVAKPGWTQTFPNSQEQYAALQIGRLATEMDFGNYQQGLISGQKFNDLDGDGLRDAGEPGLDGWSIELLDSSTSEIIETAITSGGGLYSFANLAPGGYQVREVLQDGWRQTYPNPEVYSFTLISGDVIGGTDFGNVELASISGVKFEDLNSDGVWDAGESGLDGWTIELLNADTGELLESQITSEGGLYSFVDLEAGTYQVIEIPQAGWMQTLPATSYYTVPLHYGDHIVEKDFGNYPLPGEIFGQKFEDINANGVKDAGEPGLADWRIYLDLNNSGQWDSGEPFDLTDSLGNYEITVLSPGFYTLAEELQSGWLQSMPGQESRQEIERVSVDSAGTQADEGSYTTSISGDGRYVAFESDAFNLIDGDTNGCRDVFVYDRLVDLTERVSVNSTGSQANASSNSASISADGRYVAFVSQANNLVPGDPATGGIFVHDRQTGLTECVTIDPTGAQAFGGAYYPSISGDGRYVAFRSNDDNLVAGDTNDTADIFVYDREIGLTERVSVDSSGVQADDHSDYPSISADGRYVAYESRATNLLSESTGSDLDVFVYDRQTDLTECVSINSSGTVGNNHSLSASISADGRYVAFKSYATNLAAGDTNHDEDIFVHDRQTGLTERISVTSSGTQGNDDSHDPSISADGRYVAFHSDASNLAPGDTNAVRDIFVHDRQTGQTKCLSINSAGMIGDGDSYAPSMSGDGRYVAFSAIASNLVQGDTNGEGDVFTAASPLVYPRPYFRMIGPGETVSEMDFGNYRPVSIFGRAFHDLDGDGVKNSGEVGLDGWTIELVDIATGIVQDTRTTGGGGFYSFENFVPGEYYVRELMQGGWGQTAPSPPVYSVTLLSGDVVSNMDFGNGELGSIAGVTFEDINGNAVQDAGELGLDGWTIELIYANTGQVVDTETTSGGGLYSFTGITPGDYELREVLQAGWSQMYPDPAVYSFTLFSDQAMADMDFGNMELATVSGQKFVDLNSNGVRDSGEVGLGGWTIELVDRNTGQVVATTVTGDWDLDQNGLIDFETERGLYEFTDVLPGDYKVREVAQAGWTATRPGAVGDEFGVNTETIDDQKAPVVAVADSERSIIVWQSYNQDGGGVGIYAQLMNADGTPDGIEFPVNTSTFGNQEAPAVAVDSSGNYVIVWTDDALDGSGKGVFARMFDADGTPLTGEIAINSTLTGDQSDPTVATDASGGFTVAWADSLQDGSGAGIYARRFTSTGLPATAEFPVNQTVASVQQHPAIAVDASGVITVAWDSLGQDGDGYGVYARQFDLSGLPLDDEFGVNTETASHQLFPSITANAAGRFAIAWNSYAQDGDSYGVYAQRYNSDGSIDGGEFRVNTETASSQSSPAVAMDDAGNIAVVWASNAQDGDGLGIYGQLYNADGIAAGGEFAVNNYTAGHQATPVVGISGAGRLTLAWASNEQDGNGYGVYARQYAGFDSPAHMLTLVSGQDVSEINFGNYAGLGSIQGQVFSDDNTDHQHNLGESGLDGWTIELVDPATGQVIQTIVTATVDLDESGTVEPETEAGLYEFAGLIPGNYQVREVQQIGWARLYPDNADESQSVLVSPQQITDGIDFGNLYAPAVQVISSSVQALEMLSGTTLTYTLQFNRGLRIADLDASDFSLVDETGAPANLTAWSYDLLTSTLTLEYDSLIDSVYTLTLVSGDEAFEDIYRSDLDGEASAWPIPTNTSGDGISGGDFVVTFYVDQVLSDFSIPLRQVDPAGSMVYEGAVEADIYHAGEIDTYELDLDAGQVISLVLDPDSGLRPSVEVSGPGGGALALSSASGVGKSIVVQTVSVATAGRYQFTVSGLSGTTGDYNLQLFLNAAVELESVLGISNNTQASAEDIDASFLPLTNLSDRGAVLGLYGNGSDAWYSFSLDTDESASIMLTQLPTIETSTSTGFGMDLYDSAGALLTTGIEGGSNVDWRIDGFVADSAGTYYVYVHVGTGVEYSLVVTRGAGFDSEPANDLPGSAQDITETGVALGHVSSGLLDRIFTYDPEANVILEIDPSDGTTINTLPSPVTPDPQGELGMVHAGMAVTESSLLFGGVGSDVIFELDPDTGDIIRSIATPENVSAAMAYSNGRIYLATAYASVVESYQFKTDTGSTVYYEPLASGPFVVKLSDAQYQAARADGWLNGANNFPRFAYETGDVDGANPYWLCYEDHGGDWEYSDVVVKVTHSVNGSVLLEVWSDRIMYSNDIIDASGAILLSIPSNMNGVEVVRPAVLSEITVLDYASGDLIGTFDIDEPEGGLASDGHALFGVSSGELYSINPRTGAATPLGLLPEIEDWCTGIGIRDGELFVSSSGIETHSRDVYDLETLDYLRDINDEQTSALGADESNVKDYYRINVMAGDMITAQTATPGSDPGEFANMLDPMIELYDPSGTLVAFDDNSAADGRNATLTHAAATSGTYVVLIQAEANTSGEYVLSIDGHTGAMANFTAVTDIPDGEVFTQPPTQITVNFDDNVLLTSLGAADLTVNGTPATSVSVIDNDTAVFNVTVPAIDGLNIIAISAGSIVDLQGTPIEPYSSGFVLDVTPPVVIASILNNGLNLGSRADSIAFNFDSDVIVADDALQLHNDTTGEDFFLDQASFNPSGNSWDVSGAGLIDGHYTATLLASRVADIPGNALDGDGDGAPGGDYAFTFSVLCGDADGDLIVGQSDFAMLLSEFGQSGSGLATDLNVDGRVDLGDFVIIRNMFGDTLAAPVLPAAPLAMVQAIVESSAIVATSTAPAVLDPNQSGSAVDTGYIGDGGNNSPMTPIAMSPASDLLTVPGADVLLESVDIGEYVSEAQIASGPGETFAATDGYDLRPLGDDPGDNLLAFGESSGLADILAESDLAVLPV